MGKLISLFVYKSNIHGYVKLLDEDLEAEILRDEGSTNKLLKSNYNVEIGGFKINLSKRTYDQGKWTKTNEAGQPLEGCKDVQSVCRDEKRQCKVSASVLIEQMASEMYCRDSSDTNDTSSGASSGASSAEACLVPAALPAPDLPCLQGTALPNDSPGHDGADMKRVLTTIDKMGYESNALSVHIEKLQKHMNQVVESEKNLGDCKRRVLNELDSITIQQKNAETERKAIAKEIKEAQEKVLINKKKMSQQSDRLALLQCIAAKVKETQVLRNELSTKAGVLYHGSNFEVKRKLLKFGEDELKRRKSALEALERATVEAEVVEEVD